MFEPSKSKAEEIDLNLSQFRSKCIRKRKCGMCGTSMPKGEIHGVHFFHDIRYGNKCINMCFMCLEMNIKTMKRSVKNIRDRRKQRKRELLAQRRTYELYSSGTD